MDENYQKYIKSGIARTIVSHPFDCLRIYMQNSEKKISFFSSIVNISKNHGLSGFYKGVSPFLIGNVCLLSIYTNTYNKYKKEYGNFFSGALGGFYGSSISTTIEYYRCCFFNKNQKFRLMDIPRGYPITTLRDTIGWGFFFSAYSYSKEICKDIDQPFQSIIVGSLSGLALWTSMYPIDTIKTRIQCGRSLKNFRLWSGYSSCLLRAIPVNTALVYFL